MKIWAHIFIRCTFGDVCIKQQVDQTGSYCLKRSRAEHGRMVNGEGASTQSLRG
jgi:hypothetical protein